jgi:hypothetical protein
MATPSLVIDQLVGDDDCLLPILIDFGGRSVYHCDGMNGIPSGPPPLQADPLIQTFTQIHAIQQNVIRRRFLFWRTAFRGIEKLKVRLAWFTWQRRSVKLQQSKVVSRSFYRYWKFRWLSRRVRASHRQIIQRIIFRKWSLALLDSIQVRRAQVGVRRRMRATFFRRWRLRRKEVIRIEIFKRNCKAFTVFRRRFLLRNGFGFWMEKTVSNRYPAFEKVHLTYCFRRWQRNAIKSMRLRNQSSAMEEVHFRHILFRAYQGWKKGHRINLRKKGRRLISRWAVIAKRAIAFQKVQARLSNLKLRSAYQKLKDYHLQTIRTWAIFVFKIWQDVVKEMKVKQSRNEIQLASAFVRWRAYREQRRLLRLLHVVRELTDRSKLNRTFEYWRHAFQSRLEFKENMADQFRERELKRKVFVIFRDQLEEMKTRINIYRTRSLGSRGLAGFRRHWEKQRERKERKAEEFRAMYLKRLVWMVLSIAVLRNRENRVDRTVSAVLREQHGGRQLTRIVYI